MGKEYKCKSFIGGGCAWQQMLDHKNALAKPEENILTNLLGPLGRQLVFTRMLNLEIEARKCTNCPHKIGNR
ncbi:hypothetical protein IPM62_05140 [Candidatus Woesebacteria bacterium]|nr:MAG: hypothetical protein IPM62_05140 [Candidatus Woesebacteria bacterium]